MALPPLQHQHRELVIVRAWLSTWRGIGLLALGLARQGLDLQLTKYADLGWRANLYPAGIAHSIVVGSGWDRTPWGAVQRVAWQALTRAT